MSSYVTVIEADTYFVEKYPSDEWDIANATTKQATLSTATRLINQLNFFGTKSTQTQVNEFPRNGQTDLPNAVKYACFEIAYALLDGQDVEYNSENVNVLTSKFGSVTTTKQKDSVPLHMLHNIPSSQAWNYLRPYLVNTETLKIGRMS